MSTEPTADSGNPVKRARLESHESVHSPIVDVLEHEDDDLEDDLYGSAADDSADRKPAPTTPNPSRLSTESLSTANPAAALKSPEIPGLFMSFADAAQNQANAAEPETNPPGQPVHQTKEDAPDADDDAYEPFEFDDSGEESKAAEAQAVPENTGAQEGRETSNGGDTEMTDAHKTDALEGLANEEPDSAAKTDGPGISNGQEGATSMEAVEEANGEADTNMEDGAEVRKESNAPVESEADAEEGPRKKIKMDGGEESADEEIKRESDRRKNKPTPDPEFLEAAKAQKEDENAEWRFDTSDAESSDSSSDSDSSDDEDDSDDEYSNMKPEEIAKLLLKEIDEEGGNSAPGPLRTKNEVPEEEIKVERPDVKVTPEMKIEQLGLVDSIVGVTVLIKATTSGNYQVLNEGSVLVNEAREVIGAVADTLGRVEEPLYIVRFNSPTEIEEFGLQVGKKVFYVPEHSTYVFTQPLLAQKGSDASNMHDEEAGEGEIEFSDDEKEMEYKRKQKEAKRNAQANKNPGGPPQENKNPKKRPAGPAVVTDEPYVPLQRPANLHELLSQPPPPPPSQMARGGHRGDRGNRGRGNRGNDRGGRGNRGGRGAHGGHDRGRGGRGRGGDNFHHGQQRQQQHQQQHHQPQQHQKSPQAPAAQQQQNAHQTAPPTPSFGYQPPAAAPTQQPQQPAQQQPQQAPQFPGFPGLPNFQLPTFPAAPPAPLPGFPAFTQPNAASPAPPQLTPQQQQQAYAWMQALIAAQQHQQQYQQYQQQRQQQPVPQPQQQQAQPQQSGQSTADAYNALQRTLEMLRQKPPGQ